MDVRALTNGQTNGDRIEAFTETLLRWTEWEQMRVVQSDKASDRKALT